MHGAEKKQSYIEDCGRFLLEGKLSADDSSVIRHAVITDPPGSDLSELFRGDRRYERGGRMIPMRTWLIGSKHRTPWTN